MKLFVQKLWGYLFICAISLVTGCVGPGTRSQWPEMHGKVLDADTNQPIAGAIVVAFWIGYGGHSKISFHSERSTTDINGEYVIPAWINNSKTAKSVTYQTASIKTVHKGGYRYSSSSDVPLSGNYMLRYLSKDKSTNASRLDYLVSIPTHSSQDYDNNAQQAWPLIEMIYREAVGLAESKSDKYKVRQIVRSIVYLSDNDPNDWAEWNYRQAIEFANKQLEIARNEQ